jgi:hypothetical protein
MQLKKNQLQSQLQLEKNIGCNPRMQLERISAVVPLVTLEKMLFATGKISVAVSLATGKIYHLQPHLQFFFKKNQKQIST